MKKTAIILGSCFIASCASVSTNTSTTTSAKTNAASALSAKTSTIAATGTYSTLDKNCLPIVVAIEQRMKQPGYMRVSDMGDGDPLKNININNEIYAHVEGDEWEKLSGSVKSNNQDFLEGMKTGKISLSDCKDKGVETVDGVERQVLSYNMAMAFGPKFKLNYDMTQYTGKDDGLVYQEIQKVGDKETKMTYTYKGIKVPKTKEQK